MDKVLITGASGFIGTNVLQDLLEKGYEVINLDTSPPKNPEHAKYWRKVDLLDAGTLEKLVIDFSPDFLLHLAARTDLAGESVADYAVNIEGVSNLMKIVPRIPNLKKIVVTSSMLVCTGGYFPKDQFDYAPATSYGESKVETEKTVWSNKPTCDWAIIRPSSIWGPWFGVPYKNFFDIVLSRRYFHIGNRGCTKTYGYVGNAVYQIESILFSETSDERNKVFYIGDEPATNIEEWANEIAAQMRIRIRKVPYVLIKMAALFGDCLKLLKKDFPMTSFRLHNMTTNNVMDLSNTLSIAPSPPFTRKEGITKTLEWMKEHDSK
jgi:GlcNAc-P-P-Und epimerase